MPFPLSKNLGEELLPINYISQQQNNKFSRIPRVTNIIFLFKESPPNHTLRPQEWREMINNKKISRSLNKFSMSAPLEMYRKTTASMQTDTEV